MGCLKRNVIDVCADEANHVCAFELNIQKSLCADLRGIMCAQMRRHRPGAPTSVLVPSSKARSP